METITTIGLDLAKNVFQVHGIDAAGKAVLRRKLRRGEVLDFFAALPRGLVGMEACGGAHFWARELGQLGHGVRLMPPSYVKPYVKRGKTDAADAEALLVRRSRAPACDLCPSSPSSSRRRSRCTERAISWSVSARNWST